jgi:hypothetical protein
MQRITTLEEVHRCRLSPSLFDVLYRAVEGELTLVSSSGGRYDPDDTGSIWLLEEPDGDAEITVNFGAPMLTLPFERVRHNPGNWFICHLVRNNSRCDTLIIPDAPWLPGHWRESLISQL